MRYLGVRINEEVKIDVGTATLEQLVDADDSLLARSAFLARSGNLPGPDHRR